MTAERARLVVTLAGMGLALAGIALENQVVVWFAIATLAVAFLLRWLVRRPRG